MLIAYYEVPRLLPNIELTLRLQRFKVFIKNQRTVARSREEECIIPCRYLDPLAKYFTNVSP